MDRRAAVHKTLTEHANEPFRFGVLDCCLFAADVARNITGVDYPSLFDKYTDEKSALALIEQHGGLQGVITYALGRDPVDDIGTLLPGDPCVVSFPAIGDIVGVYMGDRVIVKTEGGTLPIKKTAIVAGWALCRKP